MQEEINYEEQRQMKTMKIGNGEYPVIGAIKTEEYGLVPIVDMPLMSDDDWQRMCLKDKLRDQKMEEQE